MKNTESKQAQQLKLLSEVSTSLQGLLASDNFYQEIVDMIQKTFNYYCIHIFSVKQDNTATLEAQAGAYQAFLKKGHILGAGEGILSHVIRTKKTQMVQDVSQEPNYTNLSFPINTRSQLSIPVIRDHVVVGVLNIESDHVNAFDWDDIVALEAVSAQLAVSITNRRLFKDVKDFNSKLQKAVDEKTDELRKAHERIMDQQRLLQRENKALKNLVSQDSKASMDIIGKSSAIHNVLQMVDKIAPTTATVLIQGESGTGKELIAKRLHFRSERDDKPYVTVNCGALQEALLESELFGHEKGAFTGAVSQKLGLCETADGGTLFLDEIGELSLGIQAKLLRFLQEGEFYRISGKKPIKVDVRIISATNRDLEQEVKNGRFREDLFYRLNTITLRMPPLRKRPEDIPALVDYFILSTRFGGGAQIKRVDPKVIEALSAYEWPGNIRELQNTIERLKILADNNEIKLDDLPFNIRMPKVANADNSEYTVEMPLEDVEKSHILRTLTFYQGNKTKTAHSLGITIKTLYNKLHRYGILQTQPAPNPEQVM